MLFQQRHMWFPILFQSKPDMKTGNCNRGNTLGCLLFIAFEFVRSHVTICWGLEHPGGKKNPDFHLHPEQQTAGEEKGWRAWRSPGGQMNQMKVPVAFAHTSTKGQSQSLLQLVACLEDRWGNGAGPGGSRLPAGTSRLGWYIRSRSQLTRQGREYWDEVERLECFSVFQMWRSFNQSQQWMTETFTGRKWTLKP